MGGRSSAGGYSRRRRRLYPCPRGPGPLKRLEAYASPARIAVGYNRDDETTFERILLPGENFRSHESFILFFAGAIPQDAVDGPYARFVADHLTACDVSLVPTITVNSWRPHEFNLARDLLIEQMDVAADLGVDAYQVDAGWYDLMGDWNDDRRKFPNGLETKPTRAIGVSSAAMNWQKTESRIKRIKHKKI